MGWNIFGLKVGVGDEWNNDTNKDFDYSWYALFKFKIRCKGTQINA